MASQFQKLLTFANILLLLCGADPGSNDKMNVLFLVSDDMRPDLGCYDGPDAPSPVHPKMYTPNLDKLASRSLLLKRAYVQQAVCSPSRTSFLTGKDTILTTIQHFHTSVLYCIFTLCQLELDFFNTFLLMFLLNTLIENVDMSTVSKSHKEIY